MCESYVEDAFLHRLLLCIGKFLPSQLHANSCRLLVANNTATFNRACTCMNCNNSACTRPAS